MESNRFTLAQLLATGRLGRAARTAVLAGLAIAISACGGGGSGGGSSNAAPTAAITATPTSGKAPLTVTLDGSRSSDSDGSVRAFSWAYSDGAAGATGATTSRTFASPGNFVVTLTVTDNDGATGSATQTISVAANVAPTAAITATPTSGKAPLTVAFNGSGSADPDGTITGYAWTFGDGGTATGATPAYTYTTPGTYTARLTVTDNNSALGSTTTVITVAANALPTASFTATPTTGRAPLPVAFDGRASADPDGTIGSYQWDFGDGQVGTGATTSHTYSAGGTFNARLTVTDNEGGTGTTTRTITVSAPVGNVRVTVQDANGVAVSGASVVATVGGVSKSGTTDASGAVLLTDVVAGTGTVQISRDTYVPKTLPVTVTSGLTTDLGIVKLDRVTTATGGVLTTRVPAGGVSADGRTLEFSIQVVVVDDTKPYPPITGLPASKFALRNCTPSAVTTDADCVSGPAGVVDTAYTVLGPGAAPSFQEIPGGAAQPFAAALLFDQSGSMVTNDPTDARLFSAKEFLRSLGGSDVAALAAFADYLTPPLPDRIPQKPVTLYPVGNPAFESDGTKFFADLDTLASLEAGGTPLYEAICRTMDFTVANAPAGVRRAVVLFTDGKNDPQETTGYACLTMADTIAKTVTTKVDIFTIGLSGDVDGAVLATLADAGNGVFMFAEDVTQLIPIYGSLGNLLSGSLSTYRLTYQISSAVDGTFKAGRSVRGVLAVDAGTNVVNIPFVVRIF